MYVVTPPQRSDLGSNGDLRVYQTWKGSNIFCLQGRLIFGPDVRSLPLTISLIVVPVIIFCIFVASKLMEDFSNSWGVSIVSVAVVFTIYDLILLMLTSGRDPGIIPRNSHPPEPDVLDGNNTNPGSTSQTPRLPRVKEVEVNGNIVKVKYCDTCMLYRPPRCSHCSICNNCVERFDHHCPWVGQCIAQRNYRFFFMFVFSTTLLCAYVLAFCCVYIRKIKESEDITIWKAMLKTPASMALILYTFITVWFVGGLTCFHIYLISTNQTTYENFRYSYDRRSNPHNKGLVDNFKEIFYSAIPPSKNDFRAMVPREAPVPSRSAVGGFMSPNMGRGNDDEIEMGRKGVWAMAEHGGDDKNGGNNNERFHVNDDELGDIRTQVNDEEQIGRTNIHPRQSSWEMSPEVMALAARRP
uniref:S-acyltransferase n=1 Tax=Noccaea caerulescens TaxID=107243 RepID=A0A1J3CAU8_NOCCA